MDRGSGYVPVRISLCDVCVYVCTCVCVKLHVKSLMCPTPRLLPVLQLLGYHKVLFLIPRTLFSLFINDLPSVLAPDCTVLFADDTRIFLVGNNCKLLSASLQSCLDLANNWMMG